jgi:hypothetical protein
MNQPFEAVRGGLPVNVGLSSFNQLPQGAMSQAANVPQASPFAASAAQAPGSSAYMNAEAANTMAPRGGFPQPSQAAPINISPVTPAPVPTTPLGAPTGMTNDMAREALSNMSPMERASAMGEGFTGKNLANFANENKMLAAGMVAGPILASQTQNQPGVPTVPVDRDPGQQYDYYPGTALPTPSADPYGREKSYYAGSYRPRAAADGGMMGWPAGESVIKMADGGVSGYGFGGIIDLINNNPEFAKKFHGAFDEADPGKKYMYDAQNQQYTQQMASGGVSDAHYNLGGYSDGGRLLRGPGDGVSDSIPATIGHKQPARLADGEFVVPARIVSELGNGSTEAGARKLYAMMDRVQGARGKTVGKGKVAKNSKADKYLPA